MGKPSMSRKSPQGRKGDCGTGEKCPTLHISRQIEKDHHKFKRLSPTSRHILDHHKFNRGRSLHNPPRNRIHQAVRPYLPLAWCFW